MELISNVLYGLYRDTPQHADWVIACLEGAWPGLLGARMAAVCRPAALKGYQLTIEVGDPAWVPALEGVSGELSGKIRAATRDFVREIRITSSS
jgi:hypothetical protein